jgi:DNA mismatch repair ATPase MutS
LIIALFILFVNTFLHLRNKNNAYVFIRAFPELDKLIATATKLSETNIPFDNTAVKSSVAALAPFRKKLRMLNFDTGGIASDLSLIYKFIIEIIKTMLLIEVHAFFGIVKELENKQTDIKNIFDYAGLIDTTISVASLRAGNMNWCKPVFTSSEKKLQAKKIFHPLVPNCVDNDIDVQQKSILITGSNMAGKSTFLRTVCINALLAQTIYTCFANAYRAPMMKIFSSVRIDDDLHEGKSYFFEEAETIGALLKEVKTDVVNLFVLDEVFTGTNTIERIAAAKAVLSFLNQHNNIVFAATHDLELVDMLAHEYDLYHFAESIENEQIKFDYKLKPGMLKTRNAIKILQLLRFPEIVTQEAASIAQDLMQAKSIGKI